MSKWILFFLATVQATEESILNALAAAETMTGIDDQYGLSIAPGSAAIDHEKI